MYLWILAMSSRAQGPGQNTEKQGVPGIVQIMEQWIKAVLSINSMIYRLRDEYCQKIAGRTICLLTRRQIIYFICCSTGSQCRTFRTWHIFSYFGILKTTLTNEFLTLWNFCRFDSWMPNIRGLQLLRRFDNRTKFASWIRAGLDSAMVLICSFVELPFSSISVG